jgi:hypothetical protein
MADVDLSSEEAEEMGEGGGGRRVHEAADEMGVEEPAVRSRVSERSQVCLQGSM